MAYDDAICELVIKNVALVENSCKVLDYVDERLVEAIGQVIGESARSKRGFSVSENSKGEWYFAAANWPRREDGDPLAAFWLDCQDPECDRYWLAVLAGLAPGTLGGLFFWYDWGAAGIRRKDWKAFLSDFFAAHEGLREAGFCLNEDGTAIILPLRFDLQCLASDFANVANCLDAAGEAVEAIWTRREDFKKLIGEAGGLAR